MILSRFCAFCHVCSVTFSVHVFVHFVTYILRFSQLTFFYIFSLMSCDLQDLLVFIGIWEIALLSKEVRSMIMYFQI